MLEANLLAGITSFYEVLSQFPESLAIVQMNIGEARTPEEKGFIYMVKAENEAALGQYQAARKNEARLTSIILVEKKGKQAVVLIHGIGEQVP